jgi:hypothetical protein
MIIPPPDHKVLTWCPRPWRGAVVRCGLLACSAGVLAQICLMPWSWRYVDAVYIDVVLFAAFLATLGLGAMDLRFVHPPGHCRGCGYNLAGNRTGVCPECGRPVDHEMGSDRATEPAEKGPPQNA